MASLIVVIGRVRTDPERRAQLVDLGQRVARASREEAGCLGYRLHQDTETDNAFVFIEGWETRRRSSGR
jgi:quinol monooxygenase YgiN